MDRCIWSHAIALLANCATGGATNQSRATDILRRYLLAVIEIEPPQENGEQENGKQDKLLTTTFQIEIENRKVERLIT